MLKIWLIWLSVRKRKNILITLSDNCGSSLILHQNSVSGSSLKVCYDVESETIQINFRYSATLKSIFYLHFEGSFYPYLIFLNIKHRLLGKYGFTKLGTLPNVDTFSFTISKNYMSLTPLMSSGKS